MVNIKYSPGKVDQESICKCIVLLYKIRSDIVTQPLQRTTHYAQVHRCATKIKKRLDKISGLKLVNGEAEVYPSVSKWYASRFNMKFSYIYVLFNKEKNFLYVGYSEDLKSRVITHNKGEVTSTKAYLPLELIHYEAYKNMKDAKRREEFFKTTKGRVTLKQMLKKYFAEKEKVQL